MRTVLTSATAKIIFAVSLGFITAIGYGQNMQLNITSVIRTIYLAEWISNIHSKPAAPEYNFISDATASLTPEIMILCVSPDPCEGDFKIKVSTSLKEEISVKVFNLTGKLLRRIAIKRNEAIFFGNDLKPGNYIIQIMQGNTRKIQRLVKV